MALQNHLVAYLEKQGFALKDINQVISSSKNQNGLIEIGKLLKGLSAINNEHTGAINLASFKNGFTDYLVGGCKNGFCARPREFETR